MLESAENGDDSIHITYGVDFQRRKMEIFRKDSLILTRYYFSDYEEEHYADGRVRKIDYITGPTGLVGVNISTDGVDTLLYAFTDRFGNLVMLADEKGNVVERLAYDPWGARRNPDDWTKPDTARHLLARGYSMHEHIDCLGLINMNARVYEPATCSFLSPDPLIADEGNWLNYNRYLYCLGNPVKFADPTGMQVNNYHDVEGVLPRFVPQPIYEPDLTPQYVVNDYDWGSYAMATSKYLDAQYELIRTINFATRQATAFIDYNREAAVQGVYENMAIASAQANAAAKAVGDAGKNALVSNNCYAVVVNGELQKQNFSTFDKINMTVTGTNAVITNADFMLYCEEIKLASDYGRIGKAMSVGGKAFGVVGGVFGMAAGAINIADGNYVRGSFDIGVSAASIVATIGMSFGLSNPVGWTIIGISSIYSVVTLGYDIYKSH